MTPAAGAATPSALEPEDLDDLRQLAAFFEVCDTRRSGRAARPRSSCPPDLADAHARGEGADILGKAAELLRSGGSRGGMSERFYGQTRGLPGGAMILTVDSKVG